MIARLKRRAKRRNTWQRCGCYQLRDMTWRQGWWCGKYRSTPKRHGGRKR